MELHSFAVPFEEDDKVPPRFGIIEDTGLKLCWGIFGTSKLELFDNARCGCNI